MDEKIYKIFLTTLLSVVFVPVSVICLIQEPIFSSIIIGYMIGIAYLITKGMD